MKIGLDLHGVISDTPDFYRQLASDLIQAGWEVHVITGSTYLKAFRELVDLEFYVGEHYTTLFSIVDYHIDRGTRVIGWHPILQNPEFPDTEWDRTKADYCSRVGIGLHLDDSTQYEQTFTTPFARVWTNTGTPKIGKPDRLIK